MPTIILHREWCKKCNDYTFHSKGMGQDEVTKKYITKPLACNDCKTEYTDIELKDISEEKILLQRKRYTESQRDMYSDFINPKIGLKALFSEHYETEIKEADAGQKEIDEEIRRNNFDEYIKRKKLRKEEQDELLKYKDIGRNDDCPCNSGKKYKKCCLIRIQNITN